MRIVSWNCNGGFRRKLPHLDHLRADLLVIQEASERDLAEIDAPFTHWIGRPKGRGLAIVDVAGVGCCVHESYRPDLPWFLPLETGSLRILAVWACLASTRLRYVRLVHAALDHYLDFLGGGSPVLIGDLNSNASFDRKHGSATHTMLVQRLDALDMTSIHHEQSGDAHGAEATPTFFMYRHPDKPYHFDYAFVSRNVLTDATFEIGSPEPWLTLSDHMPLILDLPHLTGEATHWPSSRE